MAETWRLFYDSECGFCSTAMRRAVRWGERYGRSIVALPLSCPEAQSKGYGDVLVLEADRVYYAGDAWLQIFSIGPWALRPLTLLGLTRPGRHLVARLYEIAAANRHCLLPSGRLPAEAKDEQADDAQRTREDGVRLSGT